MNAVAPENQRLLGARLVELENLQDGLIAGWYGYGSTLEWVTLLKNEIADLLIQIALLDRLPYALVLKVMSFRRSD